MSFETFFGLFVSILNDKFAGLKEEVESHGAVLLVLSLAKGFTFLYQLVNDFFWRLGFFKLRLFLRFLLSYHNFAEAL